MINVNIIKKEHILTVIRSLIFVLLILSAIILMTMYIYLAQDLNESAPNDELSKRLWGASLKSEYGFGSVYSDMITPSYLFVHSGDTGKALIMNENLMREYYTEITDILFSESHVLTSELLYRETSEEDMDAIINCDSSIYIAYHDPLPLFLILYYSGNDYKTVFEGDSSEDDITLYNECYIAGIALTRDSGGEDMTVYMMCDDGNTIMFHKDYSAFPDTLLTAASGDKEFYAAHIINDENNYQNKKPVIALDDNINVPEIVINKTDKISDNDVKNAILKLFGYNPDKISSYTETGNTDVYVEKFGLMKISPERIAFEGSSDSGVLLSDYILLDNKKASIFDIVSVCDGIIKYIYKTAPDFLGGDAAIRITDIAYTDGQCVIKYSYFFDNIEIEASDAASFTFFNGYMTNAVFRSLNIENKLTRPQLIKSNLVYELYKYSDREVNSELKLLYVNTDNTVNAVWSFAEP